MSEGRGSDVRLSSFIAVCNIDQFPASNVSCMTNSSYDMSELSEILRLAVNSNKATTTEHQTAFIL